MSWFTEHLGRPIAVGIVAALTFALVVVAPPAVKAGDVPTVTLIGTRTFNNDGVPYILKMTATDGPNFNTFLVSITRKWVQTKNKRLTRVSNWRDNAMPENALQAEQNLSAATLDIGGRGYGAIHLDAERTGPTKESCGGDTRSRPVEFSGQFNFKPLKDVLDESPRPLKGTIRSSTCGTTTVSASVRPTDPLVAGRSSRVPRTPGARRTLGQVPDCEEHWTLFMLANTQTLFWVLLLTHYAERAYMQLDFDSSYPSGYASLVYWEILFGRVPKGWAEFDAFLFRLAFLGVFFQFLSDLAGESEGEPEVEDFPCKGTEQEVRQTEYPAEEDPSGEAYFRGLRRRLNLAAVFVVWSLTRYTVHDVKK